MADGKIKAVGAYDTVAAQKSADCQLRDLEGKTLMPSFIDGHGMGSLCQIVMVIQTPHHRFPSRNVMFCNKFFQNGYNVNGITTVQDGGTSGAGLAMMRRAGKAGKLKLSMRHKNRWNHLQCCHSIQLIIPHCLTMNHNLHG